MELFGIASILGKLAMTEAAKAAVAGVKNQLHPDKMELILKKAIASAQAAEALHSPTSGLFHGFQPKAGQEFIEKFLRSGEVVKELQKPLQDDGKPDVEMLVAAFTKAAEDRSEATNLHCLRPWMEAFIESYFEQVKGICFQVAKAQYLKQLAHRVDDVKFVGIAVPGEEVEKQEILAQIFVMPDVREEKREKKRLQQFASEEQAYFEGISRRNLYYPSLLEEQKEWALRDRSAPRISAQKVINLAQKKAVILGAPGSGKTMLTSYFALMLCETPQSDPTQIGLEKDADYLPVVVRIRDWILQPKMGLLEYLRSNAEASLACKELPTGFFEHWLERGHALILLDGLDEVVDEAQRRKVAEQIETFLHQYQDNPAVITSRPAGYRWDFFNLDEFPHYTLESFDDKQVATFIDHWYDSRLKEDPAQADRRKADLQKAFARNERIRLLAKNPLLLTIITLIHRYQAELPRQRCKLYEKAVETLLTSWDSGKEIKLYSQVLLFLKSDDLLYILKKLAYWIHTQGSMGETEGGTLIDKDELIRWLRKEIQTLKKCEAHEAKGEAERFIDFIQRRTGLLNEQGRDRYAFVHKTFQEYLTAEEIFDRADVEDDTEIILAHFRQHLHDQHWREVLLLLVSKLKGKKAQKAIQAVLAAGSDYEQWLHRDLLFAGWCLTEDPPELTVVAADLVGGILDRLVDLEVEDSGRIGEKIKGEAAKILHYFGETTVEPDVWVKLQAQGDKIDRFRLIEFQATLGQESKAIDTLLLLLNNPDFSISHRAAITLGNLGTANSDVVSGLLSLLYQKSHVRHCVAIALGNLGTASPDVISSLLYLLRDEKSNVCTGAAIALGNLGSASPDVVSGLLSLLADKVSNVRYSAAKALGNLGSASPNVISGLISLLDDKNLDVRYAAAMALGNLGSVSPDVISGLISLFDKKSKVLYGAAKALGNLGSANLVVINRLLSLLSDENSEVRYGAAKALGCLGDSSPDVIDGLLSLLYDREWTVRYRAARELGYLGIANSTVIDGLLLLLDDENLDVRFRATIALSNLEIVNPDVIRRLLSFLGDERSTVRYSAAKALGNLGIVNPDFTRGLLSSLGDKEPTVRSSAASALVQLAKTSDAIRPEVVQWLEQNPNDDGIGSAIDCLWSIVVE
jgi:HEAT repeat protein